MPVTFRQYINSVNTGDSAPIPSPSPSATPFAASMIPTVTPASASVTPTATPPISVSSTPTPTVSSVKYYFYRVVEGTCNPLVGTCEGVGVNNFVYSPNGSLTLGLWYTGSVNTVYQPYEEVILNYLPTSGTIYVDNNPYNSCNEACKLPVCYVSSSVVVTQTGWLSYTTCEGSTVFVELCVGSHSIDDCIKCETIAGNSGPGGSGSNAQFTYTCGYACFDPPPPSVSSTPTISVTPSISLSPSVTRTPSVTPTPTNTPSITSTPSVTPTPPISPSCECDAGFTPSKDGQYCTTSSCVPATSGSNQLQVPGYAGSYPAWGDFGVRIYPAGGFNQYGQLTVANYDYLGLIDITPTSSVNTFWARRLNTVGMWDGANQNWPGYYYNVPDPDYPGGLRPAFNTGSYPGYLSVCTTINVPSTKTYYIGIAGDNDVEVKINGVLFVNQPDNLPTDNFKWWHIYPMTLTSGPNIIEVGNWNRSQVGAFAAEIYDNTLAQLTSSNDESDLNIIFSTGDYLPARTATYILPNNPYDYSSPTGYATVTKNYPAGRLFGQAFCSNYICPDDTFQLNTSDPNNPICCKTTFVPRCSVPPSVSVTPTVTPTATVVPSVSPTPSISDTPCPTVSVTATPSISVTPTPTFGCSCFAGEIIDNNLYSYYDCNNNLLTGSEAQGTVICINVNLPKTRNIGNIGFSGNDVCGNCYDEV